MDEASEEVECDDGERVDEADCDVPTELEVPAFSDLAGDEREDESEKNGQERSPNRTYHRTAVKSLNCLKTWNG